VLAVFQVQHVHVFPQQLTAADADAPQQLLQVGAEQFRRRVEFQMIFLVGVNHAAAAEKYACQKSTQAVVHQIGKTDLPLFRTNVIDLTNAADLCRIGNGIADHRLVAAAGDRPHIGLQFCPEHRTEQHGHQPCEHRTFALQHHLFLGKNAGIQQNAVQTGKLPVAVGDASGDLFPHIIGK